MLGSAFPNKRMDIIAVHLKMAFALHISFLHLEMRTITQEIYRKTLFRTCFQIVFTVQFSWPIVPPRNMKQFFNIWTMHCIFSKQLVDLWLCNVWQLFKMRFHLPNQSRPNVNRCQSRQQHHPKVQWQQTFWKDQNYCWHKYFRNTTKLLLKSSAPVLAAIGANWRFLTNSVEKFWETRLKV